MWVVGKREKERKKNNNKKVVYVGGGGKKERKKKYIYNNIIIKFKSKNQKYVPNIYIFFLNCDFSCETKTMYQTEIFFL